MPGGRPKKQGPLRSPVYFSLDPNTGKRLDDASKTLGRKKSQIVETAVTEYLDRVETEKPQS